jgi:hypothetical protein
MDALWEDFKDALGGTIPNIIAAVAILLLGWLVAWLVASLVRRIVRSTKLGERLSRHVGEENTARVANVERGAYRITFWVIMIFVIVSALETLNLSLVAEPLGSMLTQFVNFLPQLLGAGILAAVAWGVAALVRMLVAKALGATSVDKNIGSQVSGESDAKPVPLSATLAEVAYWLVWLLFLPAILSVLNLGGLLGPVDELVTEIVGFLPNLLAAGLIAVVVWFVAHIVRRIAVSLLVAVGLDRLGGRLGAGKVLGRQTLSGLVGLVVYALILIPGIVAVLDALQLPAVAAPVSQMLGSIVSSIPLLLGAAIALVIAYFIGRVVGDLVRNLLAAIGFNSVLAKLGLGSERADDGWTPAAIVGNIVMVVIVLFGLIQAFTLLKFPALVEMTTRSMVFAAHILVGLAVFGLGLFLANVIAGAIRASGVVQANLLALFARVAILVLAGAIALQQMGLADSIILVGFGLLLGSVAVAAAIAFGVGGREVAGRELANWVNAVKSSEES